MVSVVIPVYQAETLLPRLLKSLETAPHWTVIIVDDGSTDGTVSVANRWLSGRLSGCVIALNHVGPGAARQVGLDAVEDDYVIFADADDEVVAPALQRAVNAISQTGADVCITSYEERPGFQETKRMGQIRPRRSKSHHVLTDRAAIWGKVYRVEFLRTRGITFPPLRSADDVIFSWRVASRRPRVIEWPEVGYLYWVDPHGQLTGDSRYFQDSISSLALMWDESRSGSIYAKILASYAYLSGAWHIARRVPRSRIPHVLIRATSGFFGASPHG